MMLSVTIWHIFTQQPFQSEPLSQKDLTDSGIRTCDLEPINVVVVSVAVSVAVWVAVWVQVWASIPGDRKYKRQYDRVLLAEFKYAYIFGI